MLSQVLSYIGRETRGSREASLITEGFPSQSGSAKNLPKSSMRYSPTTDAVPGLVQSHATVMIRPPGASSPYAARSTSRSWPSILFAVS